MGSFFRLLERAPSGLLFAGLLLTGATVGLAQGSDAAAEPEGSSETSADPPTVAILSSLRLNVTADEPIGDPAAYLADTEVVLAAKGGDVPCSQIKITIVDLQHQMEGRTGERAGTGPPVECTDGQISQGEAERIELFFNYARDNRSVGGSLIVEYGKGPATSTAIDYRFRSRNIYLIAPLVVALVGFGLAYFGLLNRGLTPEQAEKTLTSVKGWTFKNSWASNAAVVGGLSASVLSSTSLFDGFRFASQNQFAAVNIVLAGIVLVAPLVIGASAELDHGVDRVTARSFKLSSALTLGAITGQLVALGGPIWESNLHSGWGKGGLTFVVGSVGVVVWIHGVRLYRNRVKAQAPTPTLTWEEVVNGALEKLQATTGDITREQTRRAVREALDDLKPGDTSEADL